MKSVIRVIALWLMLVALPFQGFASASMLRCGAAHDHSAMQAVAADSQHDCGSSAKCSSMGDCCLGAALAYATPQAAAQPQPVTRLRLADPEPPQPVDLALPKRPPRAVLA
ncbi:hypothetical protein [Pseudoduganella sp. OTU4001]|uniref:hypothetical protein n=1 Tax=Pseudoduganella sp. OTU4001 TaxID=3043854 RepID=UPI00313F0252